MNQKALLVIVVIALGGGLLIRGLFLNPSVPTIEEFIVSAQTIPATPVDLVANVVGNPLDVEISVNDRIDVPDATPWTLCGVIADEPLDSFENHGFSYDLLGSLDPAEQDIMIRQDVADE